MTPITAAYFIAPDSTNLSGPVAFAGCHVTVSTPLFQPQDLRPLVALGGRLGYNAGRAGGGCDAGVARSRLRRGGRVACRHGAAGGLARPSVDESRPHERPRGVALDDREPDRAEGRDD